MKRRKAISDKIWKDIKEKVDAGWKLVDIEREYKGRVTAAQISARKKRWEMEGYASGESKWAKYHTPEYKAWRAAVLKRDGYKCVVCLRGKPEIKVLQADHIKSWSKYPELRYDIDNGRTLCVYHHKRTLNYGRRALFCDDELNGKCWEIKERMLWKKRQSQRQSRQQQRAKNLLKKPHAASRVRQRVQLLQERLNKKV